MPRKAKCLTKVVNNELFKKCTKCKKYQNINNFYTSPKSTDGFRYHCRKCETKVRKIIEKKNKNSSITIPNKKTCGVCKTNKDKGQFHVSMSIKDHLSNVCKKCNIGMKNNLRKNNNERKKSDINYPEYKKCNICNTKKQNKDFYKSKRCTDGLEYCCKICKNKKNSEWEKKNKDVVNIKTSRRRAKIRNLDERFTIDDWNAIVCVFGTNCFNCGTKNNICKDHYLPLSKGNVLSLSNCIPLCISCNSSKGSRDPEKFFSKDKLKNIQSNFNKIKKYKQDNKI